MEAWAAPGLKHWDGLKHSVRWCFFAEVDFPKLKQDSRTNGNDMAYC